MTFIEARAHVRRMWGDVLSWVRNFFAILASAYLLVLAGHGRFVHDTGVTWQDVTLATLAAFLIFGEKGLQSWKDVKRLPDGTP